MKLLAIPLARGVLAAGGIASANAASARSQLPIAAKFDAALQTTDMSARRRHWHRWHHQRVFYPRTYRYGYYPQPYYYYRPAWPVVSYVGFGNGRRFYGGHHVRFLGVGY
jgi:hypothetical protein